MTALFLEPEPHATHLVRFKLTPKPTSSTSTVPHIFEIALGSQGRYNIVSEAEVNNR